MLKESLVYIRKAGGGEAFVGCGAFVEQNLIVTCRHVWRDTGEQAEAVFPHMKRGGVAAASALKLIDACKAMGGDDPDVVLLRATDPPEGLTELQIARSETYETGEARALARLPTRKIDREIPGLIGGHIDEKGRRAFSQPVATGYWLERGSSGSPIFVGAGQQLAGLVSMAELGDEPQNAPVREAYVVPGTIIWPFVRAVAQRERLLAYAEREARGLDVAEGFVREMVQRVVGDRNLDLEGKKRAVRNAIDIYAREIAGAQTRTNYDAIVDEALSSVRSLVDAGKSGLARATLRRASDALRQREGQRRERYVAEVTALGHGERDIALAAYDGEAASDAIVALAEALHGTNAATITTFLYSEAETLEDYGRNRGSNVHLVALIALRSRLVTLASSDGERSNARNNLGIALWTLGARESGTARLEEAVAAYRAALEERTRERVPLDWAMTQTNLGIALLRLGERESGTARLEEAVAAYRAALEERTRERVPLDWAMSLGNQGEALMLIADRSNDLVVGETAVRQIETAYETLRSGGQEQWSAEMQPQLTKARAIRDRLKGQ